jgi:hypothetical protein
VARHFLKAVLIISDCQPKVQIGNFHVRDCLIEIQTMSLAADHVQDFDEVMISDWQNRFFYHNLRRLLLRLRGVVCGIG